MVEKLMETQHTLYDSLEEMLAPETLSEQLSRPVSSVKVRPLTDHYGHSKLFYIEIDAGRLVLKERLSMEYDYRMHTTNDQRCRSVRLYLKISTTGRRNPSLDSQI